MRGGKLTLLPWLIVVSLTAAGCSWVPFVGKSGKKERRDTDGTQIADIVAGLPELELTEAAAYRPTREEVLAAYERVYGLIPDSLENHAVGKRLADLKMGVGEDLDIAGTDDPYGAAIELYESLLDTADSENQDQILYQLARAHDLVGETEAAVGYLNRLIVGYPESVYIVEARFRRAEISFSAGHFAEAESDYGFVVAQGDATPYWENATYMQGWALFKMDDMDAGLRSFFTVVDSLLNTEDGTPVATDKELLKDSFRVVTLALGYLDGAETLAVHMREQDRPDWQYQVYEALADDYLANERYLDSVATWQTFIEQNTLDRRSPSAHEGMIDTLLEADFYREVRPKKEEYVRRYGIRSEFWAVHDDQVRAGYIDTLHEYLSELAKLAHAEAQEAQSRASYMKAADVYEEIVVTFPEDPATAEHLFLLGEVYTEAAEHGRAVGAFQRVVHEFIDYQRAHEAGYAAILGLEKLVATAPVDELELWQRLKIDAQIEFAMLFSADPRAPAVQGAAADSLFALGEFTEAVDLAGNLLSTWPEVSTELRKTTLLILGHGLFELEDFVAAEGAYHRLLANPLEPDEQAKVAERLLASVYKQAEAAETAGDLDGAVGHFLRLKDIDPHAELAVQGQFDAIAVIEGTGRLGEAAVLLQDFRALYPDHPLGRDVEKRLADMYERTEDWTSAAAEYAALSRSAEESEVRRQSLYRAAELYLKMDDVAAATVHFGDYANSYPEPMDLNMEAIHNLDLLAQRRDDPEARRIWLERKVELHRDMGGAANARATFLAAEAQYVFADDARLDFEVIRLTHPLPKSLKRKQNALVRTVAAFEAVADYQVSRFSTASTYQIANLYASLSQAIMDSDRPGNLSELELEQYEILLEEQAFPFEEQAIALHEINMRRSWEGIYDDWVKESFTALGRLMPARFDKQEIDVAYVEAIH